VTPSDSVAAPGVTLPSDATEGGELPRTAAVFGVGSNFTLYSQTVSAGFELFLLCVAYILCGNKAGRLTALNPDRQYALLDRL